MLNINIHPILVHFPIALLTIYSLLEFIRFKKVLELEYWFYVKAVLVILGAGATIPSILAGKIIEGQFATQRPLVELHSLFAYATTAVFGILAAYYFFSWIGRIRGQDWVESRFSRWYFLVPMSLIGLKLIMVTGALGGVIAFGPQTDPFAGFVYHLFF